MGNRRIKVKGKAFSLIMSYKNYAAVTKYSQKNDIAKATVINQAIKEFIKKHDKDMYQETEKEEKELLNKMIYGNITENDIYDDSLDNNLVDKENISI